MVTPNSIKVTPLNAGVKPIKPAEVTARSASARLDKWAKNPSRSLQHRPFANLAEMLAGKDN